MNEMGNHKFELANVHEYLGIDTANIGGIES